MNAQCNLASIGDQNLLKHAKCLLASNRWPKWAMPYRSRQESRSFHEARGRMANSG
jgi:hypothetical protein